ncbi:MAG: cell division protein FtsA [Rickettsiales bacterium]|nr:cell division protein FtsA [Pseudomonadota bacterium]MDA0967377.1 cell division protein FtsA [Pseudomonadota bacterium]MDG4544401.1 cell division protein FtsA [Rickettsiales bacterium]MDG4546531.1 cell division protein FtsA [Rickettsiales bacterium]MDG4548676.1 cell division protein FtsA [Rickettsiales bacterium]
MSKFNSNIIAVLDIGSAKVACFIARLSGDGELNVIGIGHQVAEGIKSGVIVDIKQAENSIRSAVGAAEEMAKLNIDRVIVNVSGNKLRSVKTKIDLKIKGSEISERDISRIISEGAEKFSTDEEVIHCIPVDYEIDGTAGIKNPIGMYANNLVANLNIVTVASSNIMNLNSCLALCHLNIEGYIASPYASAVSCLTEDEKELGVTLIDFGAGCTSICVFKGGKMIYLDTIAVGGRHITNDIAIGLSTTIEIAERVKTLHGNVFKAEKDEQEIIDLIPSGVNESSDISQVQKSELIAIIKPRAEEILELVYNSIKKFGFHNTGGKIVITGGASQIRGMDDFVEQHLSRAVRVGTPEFIEGMAESTRGCSFATSVGMLNLTKRQRNNKTFNLSNIGNKGFVGKVFFWLRNNF